MVTLSATINPGRASQLLGSVADHLDRNVHELIDQILQDGAVRMRHATPRGQEAPGSTGVHSQDAYAVRWDGELHGTLVNTAPQFFALWDVPEQDIHGHPVLRFWDGGTWVFRQSVHFPGPNQAVVSAWEALASDARVDLVTHGVGAVVKGMP